MVEKDLTLVGATGIEDKLQLGVPQTIEALLAEVNGGTAHRRHCKDEQQRTDELRLEIPQVCLSARTVLGRVLSPARAWVSTWSATSPG